MLLFLHHCVVCALSNEIETIESAELVVEVTRNIATNMGLSFIKVLASVWNYKIFGILME